MRKHEVPQDDEKILKGTREIQYAIDENGKYVKVHSTGWSIKNDILREAWNELDEKTLSAKKLVDSGEKSPLYFYMIQSQMNYKLLAEYSETFSFKIKKHCKPKAFSKLSNEILQKYAEIFNISVSDLQSIPDKIENSIEKHINN